MSSRPLITPFSLSNLFSLAELGEIIKIGLASRGPTWWDGHDDPKTRSAWSSTIDRTTDTLWIFERLSSAFNAANSKYAFDVTELSPHLLFARYTVGDHFDWHLDLGEDETSYRKISIAVLLNSGAEFTGGDWEFVYQKVSAVKNAEPGTAVIFPSYLPHRVTKIDSGVRYSLVGWMIGAPFK